METQNEQANEHTDDMTEGKAKRVFTTFGFAGLALFELARESFKDFANLATNEGKFQEIEYVEKPHHAFDQGLDFPNPLD